MRLVKFAWKYSKQLISTTIVALIASVLIAKYHDTLSKTREFIFCLSIFQIVIFTVLAIFFVVLLVSLVSIFRKLEIIEAKYGIEDDYKDVTEKLRKSVRNKLFRKDRLKIKVSNGQLLGGKDHLKGVPKHVWVRYKYGGRESEIIKDEGELLVLPE